MIQYTVIVNTYPRKGRKVDLKKCLQSLKKQSFKNFSTLIVENSQTDKEIKTIMSEVKLRNVSIICDITKKLSYLFNLGWRNSKSKYIGYLADDAEADKDWLKNISIELSKKSVGIATGPVISTTYPAGEMHRLYLTSQKNSITKLLSWPIIYFIFENNILKPGYFFQSGAYSLGASIMESRNYSRQNIDLATTTSMGIKRTVLEKLNGFDESFLFNHADGDLFLRTKKLKYRIIFSPHIIAHHYVRLGPSRNPQIIGRDTAIFLKRHLRPSSMRGFIGAILYISLLNILWIVYACKEKNLSKLKGISGFLHGLITRE